MSIVLITGTSTGIGYYTAIRLAQSGHKVYATMRNPQRSPELQDFAKESRLPITVLTLDVTSDESVEKAFRYVFEKEGHIDVLVNNAGIAGSGAVEETPMELFRANMETNYFGALRCIKQVLPLMRERQSGYIINVTSLAGTIASNFHSPYSASKFALESLSECLAQEVYEFNIKVAIVQPGIIDTPIFKEKERNEVAVPKTKYPRIIRFFLEFQNSLQNNRIPPGVVAKKIKKIIETENPNLRNPASIDAAPILNWRKSMTDEEWIRHGMISDEDWCKTVSEEISNKYRQIISSINQ
jgi:NAD(P)-dependent dehydrogenase (short-subunit alcohol dehydrogenase family)